MGDAVESVIDMFSKAEPTPLPPVAMSMADVSVRLSALEDKVAALEAALNPKTTRALEYTDIFPAKKNAVKVGGRLTKRKNRKTKQR